MRIHGIKSYARLQARVLPGSALFYEMHGIGLLAADQQVLGSNPSVLVQASLLLEGWQSGSRSDSALPP